MQQEEGQPRGVRIGDAGLAFKMPVTSDAALARQAMDVAPEQVRFLLGEPAPVAVVAQHLRADPFHLLAQDAVGEVAGGGAIRRGLADHGQGAGHAPTSCARRSATHFSPTMLQNSPGVIASLQRSKSGCSSSLPQATEPSGRRVVKRTSSGRIWSSR